MPSPSITTCIFSVRDLDALATRLKARAAPVVTLGGNPVTTSMGRALLVRDPDLAAGALSQTAMSIPGTSVTVVLSEFALAPGTTPPARRFDWRLQDIGSPQFQLEVSGLDALMYRTKTAGHRFLSVGARPIQRAFGRFVFAIDPDSVLVEFVEPAPTPPAHAGAP